jgi:4-amino-4-deoxy-L-arabinose transferase-like glycosyltransferase
MTDLIGWFFLFIIFLALYFWFNKIPELKNILLTAFFLRVLCVFMDHYDVITLPDANADSYKFQLAAKEFSRNQGLSVIFDFFKTDSLLISRIISIFYTIFGENKIIAQSISVVLGTVSIYLTFILSLILWDKRSAIKAVWVVAFFPTLILYSSIILRETYVVFFLLLGLIGIAKFIQNNSLFSLLQIFLCFFILIFFHGPVSIGALVFMIYYFFISSINQLIKLLNLKLNIKSFSYILLISVPLFLFFNNSIEVPYAGSFETFLSFEKQITRINNYMTGTAAYPNWLIIDNLSDFFTKGVIKIIYFIYSPFIWDISQPNHLIGLFDGFIYFLLTYYLIKNRHAIWSNPITRIFLIILITYLIIYGIGVGNFGTAIRHRSKFIILFIVLAAPKLKKFIFYQSEKTYKK